MHGTGFDPRSDIEIDQCAGAESGYCDDYLDFLTADAAGAFDADVAVSRLVRTVDFPDIGSPPVFTIVDCATVACRLDANGYSDTEALSLTAEAPISFDGSVPPPALPVVTVTPHSDLPYRAQVAVHGTGFSPGESVNAEFCADSPNGSACAFDGGFALADAGGVVDLTVGVRRRISYGGGEPTVDCVDAGSHCYVEVFGQRSYEQVLADVTFDPNAPVPPPPAATVTPDHDLGYHQVVTVAGSNFTPGTVYVSQCAPVDGEDPYPYCIGGGPSLTADASGHLSGTMTVDRIVRLGPGFSVDCATTATPCILEFGNPGGLDDVVDVPLAFDPDAPVPPPPAVTVTPSAHLFDGQHVTVAGRNFTPGTQVGVTECRAGVPVIADGCDIGQVRVATVAADGTFSRRFVTESVLGTADGPIDCTTAANACVLAVANAPRRTTSRSRH